MGPFHAPSRGLPHLVFAAPRHARAFFEALIADNVDIGRPERAEIVFKRFPRGAKARGTSPMRRNGLISRRPHANTYDLTPDGLAFAVFYTKVHDRVLAPLFASGQHQAPPQLRSALRAIQHDTDERLDTARLPRAA